MTATLLPNAKQQFLDSNGRPLAGGSVYFYIPNTSTFKSTWQDAGKTILNTNPVVLDSNGQAIIYGDGQYRQVVYDVHGNLIWDRLTDSYALNSEFQAFVSGIEGPNGAALIGYTPAGVGAVATTLQTFLQQMVLVTGFLPAGYVTDGSVDYSSYVANGISNMAPNSMLVIPQGLNLGVSRIAIDNKNDWSIRIDGKITNLAAKAGPAATDMNTAQRGLAATFYITNCNRFSIFGPGEINPNYREAFCIGEYLPASTAAPCSDFVISVNVFGPGTNDNIHANRIRYCSRFVFRNMTLDSLTKKPPYVNNSTPYYYNWCETLLLWDCTDGDIINVRSTNGASNGAYIGSNCTRIRVLGGTYAHNGASGVQAAWSSFGNFPTHITISGIISEFNRADGWDINNTGPLIDVYGIFTGNQSIYNGWGTEDTAGTTPTNDGSGIGTFTNLKKIHVANNIDHGCARTGGYFEMVWDADVLGNIINKVEAASQGDGLFFLRCTNVYANLNNVNVIAGKNALNVYSDNSSQGYVIVDKNYLFGQVTYGGGANTGLFANNTATCANTINMPVDAIGNTINVTGASQDGLNLQGDNRVAERNTVKATRFGIIAFGLWSPKLINNTASGDGGLRVAQCSFTKIDGNVGTGINSPGVHMLTCDQGQFTTNQGSSTAGNSLRIESDCTNTIKFANRSISGPTSYAGTYNINF